MTRFEASGQPIRVNPDSPCPREILDVLVGVEIEYRGFDSSEHVGVLEVHEELVEDIRLFFDAARRINFPIEKVVRSSDPEYNWNDTKLMISNATSGFNYRTIADTDTVSLHGLGRAFDVNPRQNPYVRYIDGRKLIFPSDAAWDAAVPGTLHHDHELVGLMLDRGWSWGGDWTQDSGRVDYQHLEKPI